MACTTQGGVCEDAYSTHGLAFVGLMISKNALTMWTVSHLSILHHQQRPFVKMLLLLNHLQRDLTARSPRGSSNGATTSAFSNDPKHCRLSSDIGNDISASQ